MLNTHLSPSNILAFFGWLAGWGAGEVVAMQTPIAEAQFAWWQHSAVISALVVACFMILGKLLDKYFEGREKRITRDEAQRLREIQFWKDQLTLKHLSEYESRMRAHRFGNEVNRLHSHIYNCHRLMSGGSIEIPEFKLKFYEELMDGLDQEVAKFKASLNERYEEVVHRTEA